MEDQLHAALAVLRAVVTLNMLGLTVWRWGAFDHAVASVATLAGITLWTGCVVWLYRTRRGRRPVVFVLDLAVALGALLVTPLLKGEHFNASVPGFWVMGPLLVWAVHWHWRGGLAAGLMLAVVDLGIRDELTQANYGNVFLLIVGGTVLGYMCGSLVTMAEEREAAERTAVVAAERTRLARAVHDGVLQVLALVQRRGTELGGEFTELGQLAGEQEAVLRDLIRAQGTVPQGVRDGVRPGAPVTRHDLVASTTRLGSATVTVVTPGGPVWVEPFAGEALVAAVRACLDNVRMHVGWQAPAWVLVEEVGGRAVVSVRDEGPGILEGRLREAEREGRLGVASSIRDRMLEVSGSAEVSTGSWGTEWELSVPLADAPRS